MKAKLLREQGERAFLLVFDTGDEAISELTGFAKRNGVKAGCFTGIGAFSEATLAWYSMETRKYQEIPVREQVEVVSLVGNIAMYQGEQRIHAHATVSKADGSAHGGHLISGLVRPTLEVYLFEVRGDVQRKDDVQAGLPLIKL